MFNQRYIHPCWKEEYIPVMCWCPAMTRAVAATFAFVAHTVKLVVPAHQPQAA